MERVGGVDIDSDGESAGVDHGCHDAGKNWEEVHRDHRTCASLVDVLVVGKEAV
jgi:hypothetical protein